LIWASLTEAFGKQRRLWDAEEYHRGPQEIDKVLEYIIAYADSAAPARRCVRMFVGIDPDSDGYQLFCSWLEVRVSTLREIREVLDSCGVRIDTFQLAKTIKDFLQTTWEIFDDCSLRPRDDVDDADVKTFFERVQIPDSAKTYIKYLWSKTRKAPYDIYTDRILCRMGMVKPTDPIRDKRAQLHALVANKQPMIRHKKLVVLGKRVCLAKAPRCNVCPVATQCSFAASQALTISR